MYNLIIFPSSSAPSSPLPQPPEIHPLSNTYYAGNVALKVVIAFIGNCAEQQEGTWGRWRFPLVMEFGEQA